MSYTGIPVLDLPDLGVVNSGASVVGELSGSGRFGVNAVADYVISRISTSLLNLAGVNVTAAAYTTAVNIEAGTAPFLNGVYVGPGAATTFGVFVDGTATNAPNIGGQFRALASGNAVVAQLMGTPVPGARILVCEAPAGTPVAWISEDGDISNNGVTIGTSGIIYLTGTPIVTAVSAGGAALPLPPTPVGYLRIVINGATSYLPFYQ